MLAAFPVWRVRMAAQVVSGAASSGAASETSDVELISKVGRNLVQNVRTKEVRNFNFIRRLRNFIRCHRSSLRTRVALGSAY